jgi:hypothetical protein
VLALALAEAQRGFRRVKGYKGMPAFVAALRPTKALAPERKS